MTKKMRLFSLFMALTMLVAIVPMSSFGASASYTGALQFDANGKFTVMQIADTQDNKNTYQRIIDVITDALERYDPDLIVFTGDNVIETITTTSNFKTAVNKIIAPILATDTKFAVTFGNHDASGAVSSKTTQYDYFKSAGGSNFIDFDVAALDGVGNGVIPVYAYGQTSGTPAYQVYLMDSGDDPDSGKYDCCYTNQIDYYVQRSIAYPNVPSLWFQHIIVPDIYTECMTKVSSGTSNSFKGNAAPYKDYYWALDTTKLDLTRSSSSVISDIYKEGPSPADLDLYQSTAHRSSSAYGSKTLYEAWTAYGNLQGAYFGHDHLNEFVCTTDDGIDLGYGESTTLYKAVGLVSYNDGNPGVSIYELSTDGSYTSQFVAESDLAIPLPNTSSPTGTIQVIIKTRNSGFLTAYGTDDNAYLDIYYTDGTSYKTGYLDDTADGNDFEQGDLNTCYLYNVPIKPVSSIRFRDVEGKDDWTVEYVNVNFKVNSTYARVGAITARHKYTAANETVFCTPNPTTWFTANNYTLTFNANGGTGGTTVKVVYGATLPTSYIPTVQRAGYTFTGWSPSVPSIAPGANTTYTAQWKANIINTVVFNGN